MSPARRAKAIVVGALAASLALSGAYLAAGGSSYSPAQTEDPCEPRPWRDSGGLQGFAEQFSLSALDGAACELGVSRETLARALASPESRERFTERYGLSDAELAEAVRAGLLRAVDDAVAAGALSPVLAEQLRAIVRDIPPEEAVDLLRDARVLLDGLQGFLDPARELLEGFLSQRASAAPAAV